MPDLWASRLSGLDRAVWAVRRGGPAHPPPVPPEIGARYCQPDSLLLLDSFFLVTELKFWDAEEEFGGVYC